MVLKFKSPHGNSLAIETYAFQLFDDSWKGLHSFWKLREISFSTADIPYGSLSWSNSVLSKVLSPQWYDDYSIELRLKVIEENNTYWGFIRIQSLKDIHCLSLTEFLYSPRKKTFQVLKTTLNKPLHFKKIWWNLNLGEVSNTLLSAEYLSGRTVPYYTPTSLFVQAKSYRGEVFLRWTMNFGEIEVVRTEENLRRALEATVRVRCWQTEIHYERGLPPKFVKDFGIAKNMVSTSRCLIYANHAHHYDRTELRPPYYLYLGVDKYASHIDEIVRNFEVAIPPQFFPLFECLLRVPTDKRSIQTLKGLNNL